VGESLYSKLYGEEVHEVMTCRIEIGRESMRFRKKRMPVRANDILGREFKELRIGILS